MFDYDFQRCTRHCAQTERELRPGEVFYSVLYAQEAELIRKDYCQQAWQGPPEDAVGWWKSQMPQPQKNKIKLAPNDVILQLFEQLANQDNKQDMQYVLTLFLIRRRVLRLEDNQQDENGRELMVVYCSRNETTYKVAVSPPTEKRAGEIQTELGNLLYADAS